MQQDKTHHMKQHRLYWELIVAMTAFWGCAHGQTHKSPDISSETSSMKATASAPVAMVSAEQQPPSQDAAEDAIAPAHPDFFIGQDHWAEMQQSPCAFLEKRELRLKSQATATAAGIMRETHFSKLLDEKAKLKKELARLGAKQIVFGKKRQAIQNLSDFELRLWNMHDDHYFTPASEYYRAKEALAQLLPILDAFENGRPLPVEDDFFFCNEDSFGAWAIWTHEMAYSPGPEDYEFLSWHLLKRFSFARVNRDGAVYLISEFPNVFTNWSQSTNPLYVSVPNDYNCCELDAGQSSPMVAWQNDQDGDGILEIGITESYGIEGEVGGSGYVYQFKNGVIHMMQPNYDTAEDIDNDGVMDLIFSPAAYAGEACGSGFPVYVAGPHFVGHGQADGSFSYNDQVTYKYLQQQCSAPPQTIVTCADAWCAQMWGMDETTIKDMIWRDVNRTCCATCDCDCDCGDYFCDEYRLLESCINAFELPFQFKAAPEGE